MNMNVYLRAISSGREDVYPTEYQLERQEQLQFQKKWIFVHSIFLLFVSIITIPLLHSKSQVLNNFYDHNQCCYCLWVSEHTEVSDNYEIEWSTCKNKHKFSLNLPETCDIGGVEYCDSDIFSAIKHNELSYRSNFFFFIFPKYYPYYGICNVALVALYISLLLATTYYFKTLISKQLFIGNLALTISVYYSYIKLYQYSMYTYDTLCPNPPPTTLSICYRSAYSKGLGAMFSMLVYVTSVYSAYCIYVVYPCICYLVVRRLGKYYICKKIGDIMSLILLYGVVIGGSVFVIISYIVLMWMAVGMDNNFGHGLIKNVSENVEAAFIVIIANVLLLLAFDMFFLKNCKQDLIEMFTRFRKREQAFGNVNQSMAQANADS